MGRRNARGFIENDTYVISMRKYPDRNTTFVVRREDSRNGNNNGPFESESLERIASTIADKGNPVMNGDFIKTIPSLIKCIGGYIEIPVEDSVFDDFKEYSDKAVKYSEDLVKRAKS